MFYGFVIHATLKAEESCLRNFIFKKISLISMNKINDSPFDTIVITFINRKTGQKITFPTGDDWKPFMRVKGKTLSKAKDLAEGTLKDDPTINEGEYIAHFYEDEDRATKLDTTVITV